LEGSDLFDLERRQETNKLRQGACIKTLPMWRNFNTPENTPKTIGLRKHWVVAGFLVNMHRLKQNVLASKKA
jgi:hypothetical protein